MASAMARAIRISSSSSLLVVRSITGVVTTAVPSLGEDEELLVGISADAIPQASWFEPPAIAAASATECSTVGWPVTVTAAPGATLAGAVFARARIGAAEELA
jgi:hypothetical protein